MSSELCRWCGRESILVNGYHASCAEKKDRAANHKVVPAKNKKVTSFGVKMSKNYRAQVQDFKERMARRGIDIKV